MGTTVSARRILSVVPGILCILASHPAWGQAAGLTLPEAVHYSLQNNGELRSFAEEKGIREAGKVRAGLFPNPTLEFEAGTGALTGSPDESTLSLGLSQEFLLGDKRAKRLASAERELEVHRWQLADRRRLLVEEVKGAYYEVLLAEQRLVLADRAMALGRQLLEVTRERLEAGDIPELEMNLAKVEAARAEGSRIDLERALLLSQSKLWSLTGLPAGSPLTLAGNLETRSPLTRTLADLKLLALQARPDLKALQAEKGRGDAELDLARAEVVPNLTAGLALSRDTTSLTVGGVEGRDTAYTVGVKLSITIPVFDRNQAGLQEARARIGSSESRLAATSRNLEREVEAAYASYQGSERVLALYRTGILPQLEENLNLTLEAYRLGEIGILQVIQEQKKFHEVRDGYLAALHARQAALVKLESAVATELTGGVQ